MVSSVSNSSNASPSRNIVAMTPVSREQIYDPGLYALRELLEPPPPYKKKGGFLNFLGKVALTAVGVGVIAMGVRTWGMKDYKVLDKLADDASHWDRIKNSFAKWTDKLNENTIAPIIKFLTEKKAPATAAESANAPATAAPESATKK